MSLVQSIVYRRLLQASIRRQVYDSCYTYNQSTILIVHVYPLSLSVFVYIHVYL